MNAAAWILVVVIHQGGPSVSFQEFATREACTAAAKAVEDAHYGLPGTNPRAIKLQCLAKG